MPTPAWIEECGFVVPPLGGYSLCSRLKPELQTTTKESSTSPPAALPKGEGSNKFIIKGVWDQASRDLDDDAIVTGTTEQILKAWASESAAPAGRVLPKSSSPAASSTSACLPAPRAWKSCRRRKSIFSAFPPEKPQIVGHRAKWAEDSFEYNNTPRTFDFPAGDHALLEELRSLAKQCWALFSLRGWARVDFRVDRSGRPWILEINTNPCLSPDAGFAAALARAGIPFDEALQRIVDEVPLAASQCGR